MMERIRHAEPDDCSAIALLLGHLGYPASVEDVSERLTRFRALGNGTVLVTEQDGIVVACAALEMTYPLHSAGPVLHLSAFSVSPEHQRNGIGVRMIREIEVRAKEMGCERIVVTSAEPRVGAHLFYPAVGWKYTGRRYGKALKGS